MTESLPLPAEIWNRVPPEAQALILVLLNKVAILEKRVDEFERQNAELLERLNRSSRNSSKPPSSDQPHVKRSPPRRNSGKKRGGQPGHPKHERELVPADQVRDVLDVLPSECRRCATPLTGADPQPLRHQVAEIPPVLPVVDEYRLHRLVCPDCGISTCAELPAGVPQGHFGPRLMALVATLSGAYRLGKRPLQQLLLDLCGLRISLGMICKLQTQMTEVLSRPMEQILGAIAGPAVHMDETGWRENRRKAWLWVVVTPLVTVFRIAATRGSKVVSELLGTRVNYVVNCDRAKAYRHLRVIQWCWAHLKRDFQAMIDRGGKARRIGSELLSHAEVLFQWWYHVRDGTWSRGTFQKNVANLRGAFRDELEAGLACGCEKTAATCGDLLSQEAWLWTFVRREGVEPTNNNAERSLRAAVLWRKCSGGTDSGAGSRFAESILSVIASCRQQNRHVLDYLTACCAAHYNHRAAPSILPRRRVLRTA